MDDMTYLQHRRQASLDLARRANCDAARAAHLALADLYAARIAGTAAGTLAPEPRRNAAPVATAATAATA